MKNFLLIVLVVFSVTQLWSQEVFTPDKQNKPKEDKDFQIPLIGETAPSFTAESTNGIINFPGDYSHSWKILFSHPADFTPVCTTEILELAYLQDEFDKIGVKLVVLSTDDVDTHLRWEKEIEKINFKDRGQVKIKFPIIDDQKLSISKKYGMIHSVASTTKTVRGVFIVDPENKIAAIYFYPMNVGRNTDELLRTVMALETANADKVMTPANWKAGNDVLIPYNPIPTSDLNKTEVAPDGYYNLAWFLWYKKVK